MIEKHFAKENKNAFRRRRSMKRITIVLLSVLLVASLFVSCKVEVDDPMADLVSIRFTDDDGSKGLNVSVPGLDEYTWYYRANKNDDDKTGLKTGATGEGFVIIGGETGTGKLSEKAGPFSQGLWDFELQARDGESIVYSGKVSAVSVNKDTTTVKVVVEPSQSEGNGYLVIPKNIPLYDAQNHVASNYEMVVSITNLVSGETVNVVDVSADSNYVKYSLKPVSYRVSLTYQGDNGTYVYGVSETVVTIYSNITTTLGGSVDENTSDITFGPDGTIVAAPTEITTNAEGKKEVTVAGSPADETKTTTVNFGEASSSITKGAKLSATMYPRQAAAKGFSVTDGNGVVLAGIDLKVEANGDVISNFNKAVTVSTYIGTGYDVNDLYVVYAGTGDQPKDIFYNPATGIITFTTTHFSSFYVVNTAVVAINETQNTLYKTLQEAVNAANDGDVIKLLRDASGDGVRIESGKNLTIDFNGFTYIVDGKLVGSYGTKTQGFQLLKDSNITLKNGTISSGSSCIGATLVKDENGKNQEVEIPSMQAMLLVQNYCNLSLEDITLDGSKLASGWYTLSNNYGNIVVTGKTNIIAPSDGFAFDVYYKLHDSYKEGVSVSFDEGFTGAVVGKIEISRNTKEGPSKESGYKHSLTIEAGNFSEAKFIIASVDEGSSIKIESDLVDSSQFVVSASGYGIVEENGYYKLSGITHVSNLSEIKTVDGKTASFGCGSSSSEAVVIDGKGLYVVDEWQDLWFSHDVMVKGIEFAKGVSFNAEGTEERTITIEDCVVRHCDQKNDLLPKVDANNNFRIDNSGNGLCLSIDGKEKQTVNVVVRNCHLIGDNDNTQARKDSFQSTESYNVFMSNSEEWAKYYEYKGRGNGVGLGTASGNGGFIKEATIENCTFSGLRNAAIQLYTFNAPIEIKGCDFKSWGINSDEPTSEGKYKSYAIRGDVPVAESERASASVSVYNCKFDSTKEDYKASIDRLTVSFADMQTR